MSAQVLNSSWRQGPRCSGTELRQRLNEGRDIPAWFTYPEVVKELPAAIPADKQRDHFSSRTFPDRQINHCQRADHEIPEMAGVP